MTEDFVGTSGKLEEEFVYAPNNNLRTEVFVRFEQRTGRSGKTVASSRLDGIKRENGYL